MSDSKKKMGRPPLENAKTVRIQFRVTEKERDELKKLAKKKGLTVTELILNAIEKIK